MTPPDLTTRRTPAYNLPKSNQWIAEATVTKSTESASMSEFSASETRYSILEWRGAWPIISALSSVAMTRPKYLTKCVAAWPLPVAQSHATSREVTVFDKKANKLSG